MIREGLWHLGAKAFTVLVLGYLFALAHQAAMAHAEAVWQLMLLRAVGR